MLSRSVRVLAAFALPALLAVVAGCARVDLANQWPALGEPAGWEPKPGVCTNGFAFAGARWAYLPVACTNPHVYETVHVGRFTGGAAALSAPPRGGDAALNAAWAECDAKTSEYLGGPWRQARIWIGVSLPVAGAWEGGARWFRCEAGVAGISARALSWPRSLRGELAASDALLRTCVQVFDDDDWTPEVKDCGQAHNGEFVGTFFGEGDYHALDAEPDAVHAKCRSLVAAYVGVPDDRNLRYRTGTTYLFPNSRDWQAGDHLVYCFLYLSDEKLTRSLRGGGTRLLPLN